MIAIYQEWESQNSRRNYPFADIATLLDQQGTAIPLDFLLDAILTPFDLQGFCYLAAINGPARTIVFGDSATGNPVGQAQWQEGAHAIEVYDVSGFNRPIGTLLLGPGVVQLESNQVRVFDPAATALAPTAFCAVNQTGVRGIVLPDGTLRVGDVVFEGQSGVTVSSGHGILRVDAVGVASPDAEDCGHLGQPICLIEVRREPGSAFVVSKYDQYTLGLALNGPSLDSICAASRKQNRSSIQPPNQITTPVGILYTSGHDKCEAEPLPPAPPDPGPEVVLDFPVCDLGSRTFMIVAPSALNYQNPIGISTSDGPPVAQQLGSQTDVTAAAAGKKFTNPDLMAGIVKIEIQGVAP